MDKEQRHDIFSNFVPIATLKKIVKTTPNLR